MSDNIISDLAGKLFVSIARGAVRNAADGLVVKGLLDADQRDVFVQGVMDEIEIGLRLTKAK